MDKVFTYLFFAAAMIAVAALGRQVFDGNDAGPPRADDGARSQAHELAVSGIDFALLRLRDNPDWAAGDRAVHERLSGVRIEAAVADEMGADLPGVLLENARFVTSHGTVDCNKATVQALIESGAAPSLPRALQYALFSGCDLEVNRQLLVRD